LTAELRVPFGRLIGMPIIAPLHVIGSKAQVLLNAGECVNPPEIQKRQYPKQQPQAIHSEWQFCCSISLYLWDFTFAPRFITAMSRCDALSPFLTAVYSCVAVSFLSSAVFFQ